MTKLDFSVPTEKDIVHVANHMRRSDVVEIMLAGSKSPYDSLKRGVEGSKASVVASFKGEPLVMYGMGHPKPLTGTAIIWMLGTNESLKYPREFMVYTRRVLKEMLLEARTLTNYVHTDNTVSVKWLGALGFQFDEPVEMGRYNAPFQKFKLEREYV